MPVQFLHPLLLVLGLLVIPIVWLRHKRQPAIGHPHLGLHKNLKSSSLIGKIPSIAISIAVLAMVVALASPIISRTIEKETIETRDIVIAVDISGSMLSGNFSAGRPKNSHLPPPPTAPDITTALGTAFGATQPSQPQYRPIDAAMDATYDFVEQRKGDRVALFVFDDRNYYHWPLTTDLRVILRKSLLLGTSPGGGTNFESEAGPIQAAINHFREYGRAKTKVLVMVSDGEANISPKRFAELTKQLKEFGVRIYLLGVGNDWTKGEGNASTADLRRFIGGLDGKIFAVADPEAMQKSFAEINELEKSLVIQEKFVDNKPVYHWFIVLALLSVITYVVSTAVTSEIA